MPRPEPDAAVEAAVAALARSPQETVLVTDFDGTLAPIVDDPAAAVALPGAVDVLHRLARVLGLVGVVSGRPVAFLADRLGFDHRAPFGLAVAGLYGLERLDGGGPSVHPAAAEWEEVVTGVADRAAADAPSGVGVERKRFSVTLHVRTAPECAPWARSWAEAAAAGAGLALHPGRMSWELRPPVAVDKGTVVAELVRGAKAACFIGDDFGDLRAFDALDRLAADSGGEATVVRVAVGSDEGPAELLGRADLVVDGPPGTLAFLSALLSAGGGQVPLPASP